MPTYPNKRSNDRWKFLGAVHLANGIDAKRKFLNPINLTDNGSGDNDKRFKTPE
jgi:hypothetical protein